MSLLLQPNPTQLKFGQIVFSLNHHENFIPGLLPLLNILKIPFKSISGMRIIDLNTDFIYVLKYINTFTAADV